MNSGKKIEIIKPLVKMSAINVGVPASNEEVTPWPEVAFGIPNTMLRSALFGIQRERAGLHPVDDMILMCPGGAVMKYSGPRLNQDDSLVWQMILRAVRQSKTPMGSLVKISAQEMILAMDRTDGGANFNWLKSCLERLAKSYIVIDSPAEEIRSHLLVGYKIEKKTKKIVVGISGLLYPLFANDLTDIDVLRKTKLKSQLSRWLHDFYSSHSEPIPYTVSKIKELSRAEKQTSKFRIMIEHAIEELKNCEPPLFAKESFLDRESDKLIIYKATNSPGVPPLKKQPILKVINNYDEMVKIAASKKRDLDDIEKIMEKYDMSFDEVIKENATSYKLLLSSLKPIL